MTIKPDDPQIAGDARALARRAEVSETDRSLLRMARGKAEEDLGRYDEAFANWRKATG